MTRLNVEKRLETLESRVALLQDELKSSRGGQEKDWRRAVEKYAGDADLQIVFAAAMKLRAADRRRARRKPSRVKSR